MMYRENGSKVLFNIVMKKNYNIIKLEKNFIKKGYSVQKVEDVAILKKIEKELLTFKKCPK